MTLLAFLQGEFRNEDFWFLFTLVSLIILFLIGLFLVGIYIIYKSVSRKKETSQDIFNLINNEDKKLD